MNDIELIYCDFFFFPNKITPKRNKTNNRRKKKKIKNNQPKKQNIELYIVNILFGYYISSYKTSVESSFLRCRNLALNV